MHVLVTGGCGFVGSHVALHLREKGNKVCVLDNLVRRGSERNVTVLEHHGVSFFHGDVRNREDLANLPSSIELICDTSAQPSVVSGYANPLFDITNNGLGTIHVLEHARTHRLPMIFWSSNRVYAADRLNTLPCRETASRFEYDPGAFNRVPIEERPAGFHPVHGVSEEFSIEGGQRGIYGLSKLIADAACQEYAQTYDLPIVVNRFGVISGVGQFGHADQGWVVWWAIAHWLKLPLTYFGWHGKQVRDVLFVEDMLSLLDRQMAELASFRGEVFNIGGGQANAISLCETTECMRKLSSRSTPITISDQPRKGDIAVYWTDNRKSFERLGWKPQVDLRTGFSCIFDWIREKEAELRSRYVP